MDIGRFLNLLGEATDWVMQHSTVAIGVLVGLILLAYLMSGRASK
jgi:hypothetical protein